MKNNINFNLKDRSAQLKLLLSKIKAELLEGGEELLRTKLMIAGFSIFISVLLWAFVAWDGNSEGTKNISVAIKYNELAKGYSIFTPTKKATLKLSGRVSGLSRIEESDISASVELRGLRVGKYNLPVKVETPSFVRLRSWTPSVVEVEVYRRVERRIPVTWRTDGVVPGNVVISSVDISPSEVVVVGPEPDVMNVQSVNAVLPGMKLTQDGTLKADLEIVAPGSSSERISMSVSSVNAKITTEDETLVDKIPVKVSVIGTPAEGLQIDTIRIIPDHVSVRGKNASVKKMKSLELPPVDITGLDQNLQLMIPLQPANDQGIDIDGPDRARVEITLRNKLISKTYMNAGVLIVGAKTQSELKLTPQNVTLTIEGPVSVINNLHGGRLPCELYVDVSNIVSKQITLPVLVRNLKKEFRIIKIDPEEISITNLD